MKKIKVLWFLNLILIGSYSYSQKADSTNSEKVDSTNIPKKDNKKKEFYLKGGVTVTNKGISYIPVFSLGKPALIFDLSMGNKKLSFEPQLRFSLNGEPWAFLFPVRYKIKATGKFQMTIGANPLFNFKNVTYTVNGVPITELVNRRYLGGDFRPNFFITKDISVGAYYMYFCGVSKGAAKNTHFVAINTGFSNIKFGNKFFAKINAQCYYLEQDGYNGFYFNPVITLLKKNFPLCVQSIMNVTIDSDIPEARNSFGM